MKLPDNNASTAITVLKGEFDLYRCQELYENIAACFEARTALRIDMSRVTRIDLACIQVLLAARCECVRSGLGFSLLNPTREYQHFLRLCGLEQALLHYDPNGCLPPPLEIPASTTLLRFQLPERQQQWHVSVRFSRHVYRDGGDIPACLQQLKTSGTLLAVRPVLSAMPVFSSLTADQCYLGFEIACDSDASRVLIENIFEPVSEDTDLIILSPDSSVREYAILLQQRGRDSLAVKQFWAQTGLLNSRQISAVDELCNSQSFNVLEAGDEFAEVAAVDLDSGDECFVEVGRHESALELLGEMMIACSTSKLLAGRLGEKKLLENVTLIDRLASQLQESIQALQTSSVRDLFNYLARKGMEAGRELGVETSFLLHSNSLVVNGVVLNEVAELLQAAIRFLIEYSHPVPVSVPRGPGPAGIRRPVCRIRLQAHADGEYVVLGLQLVQQAVDIEVLKEDSRRAGQLDSSVEMMIAELGHLVLESMFEGARDGGHGQRIAVSDRLAAIGGSVEFMSLPGQGDRFVVRLPVSASVIDGLLIGVGENRYVIPKRHVLETVDRMSDDNQAHFYHNTVRRHGETLPLIRLREVLKVQAEPAAAECMVVVECGRHRVGLVGDFLDGEFQTASRPLGRVLSQLKSIRGATLMPDGKVAMVLDIVGLIQDMVSGQEPVIQNHPVLHVGKCVH